MDNSRQVLIFAAKDDLADFMVNQWKVLSESAIREKGYFAAALSGGESPVPFYHKLSAAGPRIQWDRIHLFLADERFVPASNPASNYRLLYETLLKGIPIPGGNVHKVPVDGTDLMSSACMYEEEMRRFFSLPPGGIPEFDLVLLGIGTDGHTASLFPGHAALDDTLHLACAVRLDRDRHDRITLTLPVINNARIAAFLISGKAKARVLSDVVEGRQIRLPASLVAPQNGSLWFLADKEAAEYLSAGIPVKSGRLFYPEEKQTETLPKV